MTQKETLRQFISWRLAKTKKILLALGLTAANFWAAAGWMQLGSTQWGTTYYDPSSIQKSGEAVKLRYLVNIDKTPVVPGGKHRYASAINLAEYDCVGRRSRILHITEYSEAMGAGNMLLSLDSPLAWDSIVSDSVAEKIWKAACSSELNSAIKNSEQPIPEFEDATQRLAYLRWLAVSSEKLKGILPESNVRKELLQTVWYESRRAGLDPALVLGLTETVSLFRKFYVSENGSRSYMAVSPHWAQKIGDGDAQKLFHMQTNFRFGCVVLRHFIDKRKGDLDAALGDYYLDNIAAEGKPEMLAEFKRNVSMNSKKWEY